MIHTLHDPRRGIMTSSLHDLSNQYPRRLRFVRSLRSVRFRSLERHHSNLASPESRHCEFQSFVSSIVPDGLSQTYHDLVDYTPLSS